METEVTSVLQKRPVQQGYDVMTRSVRKLLEAIKMGAAMQVGHLAAEVEEWLPDGADGSELPRGVGAGGGTAMGEPIQIGEKIKFSDVLENFEKNLNK